MPNTFVMPCLTRRSWALQGSDINTPAVFGAYIDIYDISRAIEDGATVPIFYTSRLVKLVLPEEGRRLIEEFDEEIDQKENEDPKIIHKRHAQLALLVENASRLAQIAQEL